MEFECNFLIQLVLPSQASTLNISPTVCIMHKTDLHIDEKHQPLLIKVYSVSAIYDRQMLRGGADIEDVA